MIYEDIHNFLLTKASSKEIDIMLELVNRQGWDSKVRIDVYDIAIRVGTTERYVRDVLKRFTDVYRDKRVLKKTGEKEYRILKGKSVVLHRKSDKYCQHYSFMGEKEFKGLNVYGKRILLDAAYRFSLTGQRKAYLAMDTFIFRNKVSSGLIPSKEVLHSVLDSINKVYKGKVCVTVVSSVRDKKEYIYVEVDEDIIRGVKQNRSERVYLKDILFEAGYVGYLEEEYSIELEKVGKYIFNTLVDRKEEEYKGDFTWDMMELSRKIYKKSIYRLATVLQGLKDSGQESKAVSAYFSRVVYSVMMEELVKYKNEVRSVWEVIRVIQRNGEYGAVEYETNTRIKDLEIIINILEEWGYSWVQSRYRGSEGNWKKNNNNLKNNELLKESVEEEVRNLERVIKENTRMGVTRLMNWLQEYKRMVTDFIEIGNERLISITR